MRRRRRSGQARVRRFWVTERTAHAKAALVAASSLARCLRSPALTRLGGRGAAGWICVHNLDHGSGRMWVERLTGHERRRTGCQYSVEPGGEVCGHLNARYRCGVYLAALLAHVPRYADPQPSEPCGIWRLPRDSRDGSPRKAEMTCILTGILAGPCGTSPAACRSGARRRSDSRYATDSRCDTPIPVVRQRARRRRYDQSRPV